MSPVSRATLTDFDAHLWSEGSHYRAYEKLGAHLTERDGVAGTQFAVWAPNARWVSAIGDFNHWDGAAHPLRPVGSTGIWQGFVAETRPKTASKVWDLSGYAWGDRDWMARRGQAHALDAPMAVYEVHLGS